MDAVRNLAEDGGIVIGICNGFQVLCEAHLLPGALQRNAQQRFAGRPVDVRIERTDTVCTSDYRDGEVIRIPIGHGEGRYVADEATLATLERDHRIVMRYVSVDGADAPSNPNGATDGIAGICDPTGRIVGFMPHPERQADPALGSDVGQRVFSSLVASLAVGAPA
jgi:phosphoribosylformylglycinamidine synthase